MGVKESELSHDERFAQFKKDMNIVESFNVILGVDFSYSNKVRSKGWGVTKDGEIGSLHASHVISGNDV